MLSFYFIYKPTEIRVVSIVSYNFWIFLKMSNYSFENKISWQNKDHPFIQMKRGGKIPRNKVITIQRSSISSKMFSIQALIWQSMHFAADELWKNILSNERLHECGFAEGPVVLVGDRSVHVAFKKGEHGEPNARSPAMLVGTGVG